MNSFFRSLIKYGLFPVVFCASMAFCLWGFQAGLNKVIIIAITTIAPALIILLFERISPEYPNWNISRNDMVPDFLHALFSMILLPNLLKIVFLNIGLVLVSIKLTEALGSKIWPSDWPLLLQLLVAMFFTQFISYWIHRFLHEVPFLWRFHAVHHSPKRLYWLNAARFHPIDTAINYTLTTTPLIILGVPAELFILISTWVTVHGLFQHCNIKLKLGPLNYIFSMAELHRWHHSLILEEANTNYGNNIIFWDIVFGTYFHPSDRDAPEEVGLHDIEAYPEKYLQQLAAPFKHNQLVKKE